MLHPQHLLAEEELVSTSSQVLEKNITSVLPASWLGESRLGSGAMDALSLCAEAGWLYRRVQLYIISVQGSTASGSIARAFACALSKELKDYLQLLAELEQEIDRLHLRQLRVQLRVPLKRLQTLAILTDSLQFLTGGPLLAALHEHVRSGDPRHVDLVNGLLHAASKPWFQMLHHWTTEGILSDPAGEFFVVEKDQSQETNLAQFAWNDGFVLDKSKLPGTGIMDDDLVEPAFRVGKGVNFVRRCLMDGEWSFGDDLIDRAREAFCFSPDADDSSNFRSTLTEAMRIVHSHILDSLHSGEELMTHLYALKQFMLLGQGDFFSALMEGLSSELGDKVGVAGIYKHTVTSIVESALRSTNANDFPQHVLERLTTDLLLGAQDYEYAFGSTIGSKHEKDTRRIWELFAINYSVPEQLKFIVDESAKDDYAQIFRSLFSLKTIEHKLNSTWRSSATLQHALQVVAQQNGLSVTTSSSLAQSMALLRRIAMTRQAMVHFVVNYKSYLMFDVLEGGWKHLVLDIQEAETLDDIVAAHSLYLRGIVQKSLLGSEQSDDGSILLGYSRLGELIGELMELCQNFCDYQELFFKESLEAADRAKQKRRLARDRADRGNWSVGAEEEVAEETNFFGLSDSSKHDELATLVAAFHDKIGELLVASDGILNGASFASKTPKATPAPIERKRNGQVRSSDASNMDSLRFLVFQLDQNNFYEYNHRFTGS